MGGDSWSAPNHTFSETTVVGVNKAKSDYDYNYKTVFQNCKENKQFERQNISRSRTPLDSTPAGTKTPDAKISPLDSTPFGATFQTPEH